MFVCLFSLSHFFSSVIIAVVRENVKCKEMLLVLDSFNTFCKAFFLLNVFHVSVHNHCESIISGKGN